MNKPITINIKDTANEIRNILEISQLHPILRVQIIQEIYSDEVQALKDTSYREEQEYINQVNEKEKNDENRENEV